MKLTILATLAFSLGAIGRPARRAAFGSSSLSSFSTRDDNGGSCNPGDVVCVNDQIAMCVDGQLEPQDCSAGTSCTDASGSAVCDFSPSSTDSAADTPTDTSTDTPDDGASNTATATDAIQPAQTDEVNKKKKGKGKKNQNRNQNQNQNQNQNNGDDQNSLTLNPAVLAKGFESDGQQNITEPNQVASLTSKNNFINFCLTVPDFPITNGKQIKSGSCNPAPMGVIPSSDNMPSAKFVFPKNTGTVQANTQFTVKLAVNNLETGNFVNAQTNYYSAPQQLNDQGQIIGHSHIVIEDLNNDITSTKPLDPTTFTFFKGVNAPAEGGVLSVDVDGLKPGVYRMSSINSAANHQPVLVPVAQRGAMDDVIYFTVQ